MRCAECHDEVETEYRYNDQVFCSSVCLSEWYDNKPQSRRG